jgi:hypothetical protein
MFLFPDIKMRPTYLNNSLEVVYIDLILRFCQIFFSEFSLLSITEALQMAKGRKLASPKVFHRHVNGVRISWTLERSKPIAGSLHHVNIVS